ncbi:MAG: biotin transporter BioY [Limnochordia bacterium]|nr:biotin transporter BioY [Limnochordia bacterium]MDD4517790.1 biotin transporter BioY [Limnochordia bacterium]
MHFSTLDITKVGLFAAFAVIAAMLLRFAADIVPFSLLPFVAIFAGTVLGKKLGSVSMFLYILLGLIGLPVFAAPPFGGIAYVLNPTFGFLLGFVLAAYTAGLILEKFGRTYVNYLVASIAGILVIYLIGIPYLALILHFYMGQAISLNQVLKIGFYPFIPLDLIKAVISSVLAYRIKRRLP